MAGVGPGVYEVRIRTAVEHRVFYVAKFAEGVYVLHAFQKKTQQTALPVPGSTSMLSSLRPTREPHRGQPLPRPGSCGPKMGRWRPGCPSGASQN